MFSPKTLWLAAVLCVASACTQSTRDAEGVVSNEVVAVSNAGGEIALDAMCLNELHAIGHQGHRVAGTGTCQRDDAPAPATPAELAALAAVRVGWHDVRTAYSDLADASDAFVAMLQGAQAVATGDLITAMGRIASAYAALVAAAANHHIALPAIGAR